MKKVLAIITLLLISSGAMAQLDIVSEKKSSEFLTDNLMYDPNIDSYTLFFHTTNQFDDAMMIKLGNKAKAIKTIEDLIKITEIKEEKDFEINNGYGEKFRIYTGYGYPTMHGDGYASNAKITFSILEKAKNKILNISDISEKKVNLPDVVKVYIDLYYRNSDSLFYINSKTKDDTICFKLGNGKAAALKNSRYIYNFKDSKNDTLYFNNFILVKKGIEFVNDFEIIYNNKKSDKINFSYMLMYEHKIMHFDYYKYFDYYNIE